MNSAEDHNVSGPSIAGYAAVNELPMNGRYDTRKVPLAQMKLPRAHGDLPTENLQMTMDIDRARQAALLANIVDSLGQSSQSD